MSANFRMPHTLKNGPEYTVMDNSCTIVTVIGYGNSLSNNLLITLLVELVEYHRMHNVSTVTISFLNLLSTILVAISSRVAVLEGSRHFYENGRRICDGMRLRTWYENDQYCVHVNILRILGKNTFSSRRNEADRRTAPDRGRKLSRRLHGNRISE